MSWVGCQAPLAGWVSGTARESGGGGVMGWVSGTARGHLSAWGGHFDGNIMIR
ncbi:hypothetical protein [Neobacillus sp. NPDC093127]|uniref:hypothetical protein n=1 Tax=Neobacillus sp. NPDC093127 TaxID=3364296 RepID=UPI00381A8ED0